jgi:hypothetical protein
MRGLQRGHRVLECAIAAGQIGGAFGNAMFKYFVEFV